MKLFICEKPSQAKDIAQVLGATTCTDHCFEGAGLQVTWCIGHLLELAPPEHYCPDLKPWRMAVLPVAPHTWTMLPQEKTKKQLAAIGKLLKKATSVVIATDADREGDVIGREVLDYFNYQGHVERLWLSALDEASIKKALANIRTGASTESLYQAGLGRQRADWLVGMNLTMAASCLFGVGGQGVLSVGRVQTPTLKLVVDKDMSIEQFKPQDFFTLKAACVTPAGELFWTHWVARENMVDVEGRCLNRALLEGVVHTIANHPGRVSEFHEAKKATGAPLCLSLSALQKRASAQFGFSAKHTLETAQSLYEKHKATSYPRTDCGYLPESQWVDAALVFDAMSRIDPTITPMLEKCDKGFKSKSWQDKKITAHHAIIPTTNPRVDLRVMSESEHALYTLIRAYYIAQFLGDYEYAQRQVFIDIGAHQFKASSHTPLVAGWKTAISGMEDKEEADAMAEDKTAIPRLSQHDELTCSKTEIQSCKTKASARFTEGTLIAAMKSIANYVNEAHLKKILKDTAGIGTEATRANILETLVNREYLKRQGKQLISTTKGRELIQLLPASITNPATTALWEQTLDRIAQGEGSVADFLDDQCDTLEGMLEQLAKMGAKNRPPEASSHPCPDCQKPMYRRQGKKGYWWGCSGYPVCKTTFLDDRGKPKVQAPSVKYDEPKLVKGQFNKLVL